MSTPEKNLERILQTRAGPDEVDLSPLEWEVAQAVVGRAMRDQAVRTKTRRAWAVGTVAVVLAASMLGFFLWQPSPSPQVSDGWAAAFQGEASRKVTQGDWLQSGDEVEVADQGHVKVAFPEGSQVGLESASRVAFESLGKKRRFRLKKGIFSAQVKKLQSDEQFVVRTTHALVEVRGTQFKVEVEPPSQECVDGATRVRVTEGLVEVQASDGKRNWVRPGEDLRVGCVAPVGVVEAATADVEEPEEEVVEEAVPPLRKSAPKTTSSLARMNRLYEKAMEAKKSRHFGEALRYFSRIRREFPAGPLDEAAAVERMRLYDMMGSKKAILEARDYLEQFPHGYARDVASDIVDESKP